MSPSDPPPGDVATEENENNENQQASIPRNPAQPSVVTSETVLTSASQVASHCSTAPLFDINAYVNSPEFNWHHNRMVGVDWENIARVPTGSSIIDNNSVTDESGRSFHGYKEGKYFIPNDAAEQDRLDFQHAIYLLLFDGKLAMAPVKEPEFVLDIGTGTGIWALEFADQHPNAQVIGTDLSEIQPKWKVPNCSFIQEDSEEEWLFGNSGSPIRFDYVHLRMVFTCFNNPRNIVAHAYKNMRPGGWIEYVDSSLEIRTVDDSLQGTALQKWCDGVTNGMAMKGRDLRVPERYGQWLREEGFVDVVEQKFLVPCNPWPQNAKLKKIGQYVMTNLHEGLRGGGWKALAQLGYPPADIEQIITDAKRDLTSSKYRTYVPVYVVYGRVPFDSELNTESVTPGVAIRAEE